MTTSTLPPDIRGAIGVYIETHRAMLAVCSNMRRPDSKTSHTLREDFAAGAVVLELIYKHFGGEATQ